MTSLANNIPFRISNSDPNSAILAEEHVVVGQLGQTLDGCIATPTGESKYINSDCGLKHLHALRSVVDAVVVGVGSVNEDDPRLTVRLCSGPDPIRVIIDPNGRVNPNAQIFRQATDKVIIITSEHLTHPAADQVSLMRLPVENEFILLHSVERRHCLSRTVSDLLK